MSTTEETNPNTVSGLSPPLDELRADLAATAAPGSTLAAEVTAVGAALAPTEPEPAPIGTDERGARLSRPAKSTQPNPPAASALESLQADTALAVGDVATGDCDALAIVGRGGRGKSYVAKHALDTHPLAPLLDIERPRTGLAPTMLYKLLFERRGSAQITVLEDIESLLRYPDVVRILRSALWGPEDPKTKKMVRMVDWDSKEIRKLVGDANVKFQYEGRLIFILNDMTGHTVERLALSTRINVIPYDTVTDADVFIFMRKITRNGYEIDSSVGPVKISKDDCAIVIDHLEASAQGAAADLRLLVRGLKCFRAHRNADAWKSLLDRYIAGAASVNGGASGPNVKGARERLILDLEANTNFPTVEAKAAEFARIERCVVRTYYRYRNKVGLSESKNVIVPTNAIVNAAPTAAQPSNLDHTYLTSKGVQMRCRRCGDLISVVRGQEQACSGSEADRQACRDRQGKCVHCGKGLPWLSRSTICAKCEHQWHDTVNEAGEQFGRENVGWWTPYVEVQP